jgi:hypothetical protein
MRITQLQALPDTTGCDHSHAGIDGPVNPLGNMEVAFCTDCNHEIGFIVDEARNRTGETKILLKVSQEEPRPAEEGEPGESGP